MKRIQLWMMVFVLSLTAPTVSNPVQATTVFGDGDRIEAWIEEQTTKRTG